MPWFLISLSFSLFESTFEFLFLHFDSTFNPICLLVPFASKYLGTKTLFSLYVVRFGWKILFLLIVYSYLPHPSSLSSVWLERKRPRNFFWNGLIFGFPNAKNITSVNPNRRTRRLNSGWCFRFIGFLFLGSQIMRNSKKNPLSFNFAHFPGSQTHLNIISLLFALDFFSLFYSQQHSYLSFFSSSMTASTPFSSLTGRKFWAAHPASCHSR